MGGWLTPRPGRFTPGNDSAPSAQEAGWDPGPVGTGEENLSTTESDPRTIQPISSRYTEYAIHVLGTECQKLLATFSKKLCNLLGIFCEMVLRKISWKGANTFKLDWLTLSSPYRCSLRTPFRLNERSARRYLNLP